MTDRLRATLSALPPFPANRIGTEAELRRAMALLSYLGHAYVWGGSQAADVLPARLAVPWHAVAGRLGRPPVLSYASYALDNWIRFDTAMEPELGNIALIQNFLGGEDEEWFILIHVDIERRAAPAIRRLPVAQELARERAHEKLTDELEGIAQALDGMVATMRRMPERCDPYIYYRRVRPYIHGWRNHPDLPNGLVYEGVEEYDGKPKQIRGETGAQSTIVPCLDAVLGVEHQEDILRTYLMEMREYMPSRHRAFLESLEAAGSIRSQVRKSKSPALIRVYDRCVALVEEFRSIHLQYAATYIHKQAQTDSKNPHAVGTGGTPFMRYLKKHRDETSRHRLG